MHIIIYGNNCVSKCVLKAARSLLWVRAIGQARGQPRNQGKAAILHYPDIAEPGLGTGAISQVAEGVQWLRMPVPGSLEAINLWALAGKRGWTLVDSGLNTQDTQAAWQTALSGPLSGNPVERLCLTHMHPDHSGLAGWLVEANPGAELWISRLEFFVLRSLAAATGQSVPDAAIAFFRRAGWGEAELDGYRRIFGSFGRMVYSLPESFVAMVDGDVIDTGLSQWEVVTGRGHSPEQSLLYSPELEILIAGDQILPGISPNVSVYPQEPKADPLTDYLRSLAHIRHRVPDRVLVLPSHGKPFRGLHARIEALIDGHEQALRRLHDALQHPKRAVDAFGTLFKRGITGEHMVMATGESLAHLACLRTRGLAASTLDADGIEWWQAT